MRVLVVPRRSGWEISDTKMGAETRLLPALCPVANLFNWSLLCSQVGEKNLPIRRKVVDGAKPIKSRPGGISLSNMGNIRRG